VISCFFALKEKQDLFRKKKRQLKFEFLQKVIYMRLEESIIKQNAKVLIRMNHLEKPS